MAPLGPIAVTPLHTHTLTLVSVHGAHFGTPWCINSCSILPHIWGLLRLSLINYSYTCIPQNIMISCMTQCTLLNIQAVHNLHTCIKQYIN